VKALSVRQPWAELIARGAKTLEVRSRRAHYRGPLAIVASNSAVSDDGMSALAKHGLCESVLSRGQVICVVELIDSRPMTAADAFDGGACCPFEAGKQVWVLRNARRVEPPLPMKGQVSMFPLKPDATQAIQVRLQG
jgi:hypothetical protein